MELVEIQYSIDSLWIFKEDIIFKRNNVYTNLESQTIKFVHYKRISYSDKYIFVVINSNIDIYNLKFQKITTFQVENPVGIAFFDGFSNYIIRCGKEEEKYLFYHQNILLKEENNVIGILLNRRFRLHFTDPFSAPTYFRCSNLLDTETYWDYDCGEGKEAGKFYVWNDNLVFTKGNHEGTNLVVIELITGRVLWEIPILYGAFSFDSERGLLVSFWCSKLSGNNYQIIDLQHKSIENGTPDFSVLLENVALNWQMQYLHENKLYFVDNVYSIHGEPSHAPRFGRFDIKTKRIDFLQEVPEASGCQFEQVFYHNSKLYLRSSANQLFIFED
ncbi:MAG: hypothetical protein ACOVQ4_12535 [Flectobacillus sp.]|uniref:hypothetical protein n=1 Tax=Flectobacillus sp. TaxID=50419 RepID=UPI003B997E37